MIYALIKANIIRHSSCKKALAKASKKMYPLGTIQGLLLDPCITKLFIHFHEKKFSTGLFFFPFLLLFWGLSCFFMVYGIPLQSIKRCLEITWCYWVPYFHTLTEKSSEEKNLTVRSTPRKKKNMQTSK